MELASTSQHTASFAEVLRARRGVQRLTQAELAEAVGVTAQTICRWEAGARPRIAARTLAVLADTLGVSDRLLKDALLPARAEGVVVPFDSLHSAEPDEALFLARASLGPGRPFTAYSRSDVVQAIMDHIRKPHGLSDAAAKLFDRLLDEVTH